MREENLKTMTSLVKETRVGIKTLLIIIAKLGYDNQNFNKPKSIISNELYEKILSYLKTNKLKTNKLKKKRRTNFVTDQKSFHKKEEETKEYNNYDDPSNPAHNSTENPWILLFGRGEEADTAYWNTE